VAAFAVRGERRRGRDHGPARREYPRH
jgi:hypothetical protein